MGDVVNLRMARKAKARADAEMKAAENRVKSGRTKAEKRALTLEANRAGKAHAAGRIESDTGIDPPG